MKRYTVMNHPGRGALVYDRETRLVVAGVSGTGVLIGWTAAVAQSVCNLLNGGVRAA